MIPEQCFVARLLYKQFDKNVFKMFIENLKSEPGVVSASLLCQKDAKFLIKSIVFFSDSNLQNIFRVTGIKVKWSYDSELPVDFPESGNLSIGLPNFRIKNVKIIFNIKDKNIFSDNIDTEIYVRFNYRMREYGKDYSIVGRLVCEGSFVKFKWI